LFWVIGSLARQVPPGSTGDGSSGRAGGRRAARMRELATQGSVGLMEVLPGAMACLNADGPHRLGRCPGGAAAGVTERGTDWPGSR
jgi:hypothetical protein